MTLRDKSTNTTLRTTTGKFTVAGRPIHCDMAAQPLAVRLAAGLYEEVYVTAQEAAPPAYDDTTGTVTVTRVVVPPVPVTAAQKWQELSDECKAAWLRILDLAMTAYINDGIMVDASGTFRLILESIESLNDTEKESHYYMKFDMLYVNDLVLYHYSNARQTKADAELLVPWLMAGSHLT